MASRVKVSEVTVIPDSVLSHQKLIVSTLLVLLSLALLLTAAAKSNTVVAAGFADMEEEARMA